MNIMLLKLLLCICLVYLLICEHIVNLIMQETDCLLQQYILLYVVTNNVEEQAASIFILSTYKIL